MLAGACQREVPPTTQATVSMAWRKERLVDRGGGVVHFATDRGYQVDVQQGMLRTWRIGLVPCPADQSAWALVGSAWANHSEPPDPAALWPNLAEAFGRDGRLQWAVKPARYCSVHWLVSAPPPGHVAEGEPRTSIDVQAAWTKGSQQGQVHLQTWLPAGQMRQVPALRVAGAHAELAVVRDLAAAFDGVELAEAATQALAWTVLKRLTENATLEVAAP